MENRCIKFKNVIKTLCGYFVKIKFKASNKPFDVKSFFIISYILFNICVNYVYCNKPPRFLIDGQTEIVLRLREGFETPVGK